MENSLNGVYIKTICNSNGGSLGQGPMDLIFDMASGDHLLILFYSFDDLNKGILILTPHYNTNSGSLATTALLLKLSNGTLQLGTNVITDNIKRITIKDVQWPRCVAISYAPFSFSHT